MKTSHGFTLVEIAVVLAIIALLIGGLLIPMSMQVDQHRIKVTQQRLEEIKEALIGFTTINGYLPCPTDENGKESRTLTQTTCNTYDQSDGYLPWNNLGVEGYDAWGHPFRYRVDGKFSDSLENNPIEYPYPKNEQALEIRDRDDNTLSFFDPDLSDNDGFYVVAIIFSCGKNGKPDDKNATSNPSYSGASCTVSTTPTNNEVYTQDVYVENTFDDILVWLPKNILINRLVMAGKWP
ncbi:prepilin-type N-terminal cleavage/methylation domain-containing protein [Candidatus Parabeggiatoa sp. HSG14]|uniref:type II secretion system protein n=1 Tax=Candidatus Parabeggiatoa sp. HSG14 TaxID=3055593 RepID=UPI0025A7BDA6|nr:prepilin-type N-terminal cleavage/methylation domain-containing protein [Thiotrichales bacterium HSG14]